jgi:cytoskeleton protein RodZ
MFEIGNSLREARLRQRLDFEEVEQVTKIRAKYLRALEDEAFDALPSATYVKGFLRTYADSLGLEGQLYVDEYNSRFATGDDELPPVRPRRSSARPVERQHRRTERNVTLLALLAIVAITALVFGAWRFGGSDSEKIPNLSSGPAAQKPKAARTAPTPARLVLTATRGNAWLEVHRSSAAGKLVFRGTLERGQTQRFTAPRLWLNVASPANLRVRLNGRSTTIPGRGTPQIVVVTANGIASNAVRR